VSARLRVATVGDTAAPRSEPSAAAGRSDVIALFPERTHSEVQRGMTTAPDANVHAPPLDRAHSTTAAIVEVCSIITPSAIACAVPSSTLSPARLGGAGCRLLFHPIQFHHPAVRLSRRTASRLQRCRTGNFGDVSPATWRNRMGLPIRALYPRDPSRHSCAHAATGPSEVRGVTATTSVPWHPGRVQFRGGLLVEAARAQFHHGPACADGLALPVRRFSIAHLTRSLPVRTASAPTAPTRRRWAATSDLASRETGYLMDPHPAVAFAWPEKAAFRPGLPIVVAVARSPGEFPDAVAPPRHQGPERPTAVRLGSRTSELRPAVRPGRGRAVLLAASRPPAKEQRNDMNVTRLRLGAHLVPPDAMPPSRPPRSASGVGSGGRDEPPTSHGLLASARTGVHQVHHRRTAAPDAEYNRRRSAVTSTPRPRRDDRLLRARSSADVPLRARRALTIHRRSDFRARGAGGARRTSIVQESARPTMPPDDLIFDYLQSVAFRISRWALDLRDARFGALFDSPPPARVSFAHYRAPTC